MPDLIDPLADYPTSTTFAGISRPSTISLAQHRRRLLAPCSEEGYARIHRLALSLIGDRPVPTVPDE